MDFSDVQVGSGVLLKDKAQADIRLVTKFWADENASEEEDEISNPEADFTKVLTKSQKKKQRKLIAQQEKKVITRSRAALQFPSK